MIEFQGFGLPRDVQGTAKVFRRQSQKATRLRRKPSSSGKEKRRFEEALKEFRAPLRSGIEASTDETIRELYTAQLEMSEDPMLIEGVESKIEERRCSVEEALEATLEEFRVMFESVEDPLIRSRFDDVRDLIAQLYDHLQPRQRTEPFPVLEDGTILVADEILPSEALRIDFSKVVGIICAYGNVASHVSIIARAKGIPAIIGVDISKIRNGETIVIHCSGMEGLQFPEGAILLANVGNDNEVEDALKTCATGIGLFRTEFLLMQGDIAPDEASQYDIYCRAARLCKDKPLIIRTIDLGGDKVLPYMPLPSEENPALGLRGIRLALSQPDLFKIQLRALLRAATEGDIRIMLPMISTLEEVRRTKELLQECANALAADGVPYRMPPLGVMIETPAAVFMAEELAGETDFFSIGTNDLVQYVLAADRGNGTVAYLYNSINPAVLKAIRMVVEGARKAKGEDFPVEVCGEAAAHQESIDALWECGIRRFSVSPALLGS